MSDEVTLTPIPFINEVNSLVGKVLMQQYASSPQFVADKASMMSIAATSDEDISAYLQTATASGVSIESAMICISLFLQLRLSQNQSNG